MESKAVAWGWNDINECLPLWKDLVAICTDDGKVHYGYYDGKCEPGYWCLMTTSRDGDFIWNNDKDVPSRLKPIGWDYFSFPKTYEMLCKWTTIDKANPPSGQRVLVYVSSGDICTAFYSDADQNWHFIIGLNSFTPTHEQYASGEYTVLAWTELPTYPYKPLQQAQNEENI